MILYTINGSGSDAVKSLANYCNIKLTERPRSEHRSALEAINPAATVPTLDSGDWVTTETAAILRYLAKQHNPDLLGTGDETQVRVDEIIGFLSTGMYSHYIQFFRPEKFVSSEAQFADVKSLGLQNLAQCLDLLEKKVDSSDFLAGDQLSIADFYAMVLLKWQSKIQPLNTEYPKLQTYWQFIQQQPWFIG